MNPFLPAKMPPEYFDPLRIKRDFGVSMEEAHRMATLHRKAKVFKNDRYQVNVVDTEFPGVGPMKHLSVKRLDKEAIHDWRDLQEIKNQLVGPECEGLELYPADSRMVDAANQFHLWVFTDPEVRIPIGFQERLVDYSDSITKTGGKQRPLDQGGLTAPKDTA